MLVSDVHCNGTEKELYLCPITERSEQRCNKRNSAGVICSKSIGKCQIYIDPPYITVFILVIGNIIHTKTGTSRKCTAEGSTPLQNQKKIIKMERYSL